MLDSDNRPGPENKAAGAPSGESALPQRSGFRTFGNRLRHNQRKIVFSLLVLINICVVLIATNITAFLRFLSEHTGVFGATLNPIATSMLTRSQPWSVVLLAVVSTAIISSYVFGKRTLRSIPGFDKFFVERTTPLPEYLAGSYITHWILFFALIVAGMFTLTPEKKQEIAVEFVLQSKQEENHEKTNKIAEKSAKAHGQTDPKRLQSTVDDPTVASKKQEEIANQTKAAMQPKQARPKKQASQAAASAHKVPVAQKHKNEAPEEQRSRPHLAQSQNTKRTQTKQQEQRAQALQRAIAQRQSEARRQQVRRQQASGQRQIAQVNQRQGSRLNSNRDIDKSQASIATNADPSFGAYMAYLNRSFKRHWTPPAGSSSRNVVVNFTVRNDGSLASVRLARSCGNPAYDQAAINAVRAAAPLRPLPAGSPDTVAIEYTFDYTMTRPKQAHEEPYWARRNNNGPW